MNVAGALVRGVSMIYATTVGKEEATAPVMIAPDADQVKISICPGVSRMILLDAVEEGGVVKSWTRLLDCICPFLKQAEHLLKFGREQIQSSEDAAVWT
jgi:hypothetical protein